MEYGEVAINYSQTDPAIFLKNSNNDIIRIAGAGPKIGDLTGNVTGNVTGALTGNADTATKLATGRTIAISGDATYTSAAFDGSSNVTGALTLANSGVTANNYGSSTAIPVVTVDAKGRVTAATTAAINTSFTLSDGTNTQTINGGDTLTVTGGSNLTSVVGANDTVTLNLDSTLTGLTSITSTNFVGNLTGDVTGSIDLDSDLDMKTFSIITSQSNRDVNLNPHGSGVVVIKGNATRGSGQLALNCENNSHGVKIKGPAHSAGATYTLTLPTALPTVTGQSLVSDTSGVLSFSTIDTGNPGFLETPALLSTNTTISANVNAGGMGTMAIASGIVFTVPSTSTYTVIKG